MPEATCTAPVNIAVVKYWGKREPLELILPTNSSLSVTLSQDHLRSKTTIRAEASFDKDRLWLNGEEEEVKSTGRMANCLREMRALRKELEQQKGIKDDKPLSSLRLHIVSENNFPTAAGLASSASGFAALVATLASLFQLPSSPSDLSRIARQGSGSACRSLFGGFVAWEMGNKQDGSDSLAVEVGPQSHWPEMQALICVVSDLKKGTPSTAGMQRTVATSPLLQARIKGVPDRMARISKAIQHKDFNTFAEITMQDSNQFHACCLDTSPPIFYMNDISRSIIQLVTELNRAAVEAGKGLVAAYTYDAGPNAVIYALKDDMKSIIELVNTYFPQKSFNDRFGLYGGGDVQIAKAELMQGFKKDSMPIWPEGSVKEFIHTEVGDGPRTLGQEESLCDAKGMPKFAK